MTEKSVELSVAPDGNGKKRRKIPIPKINIRLSGSIRLLIFCIGLAVLAYNSVFVYVRPNEYGIKVIRIGVNRGVQKEVYTAGLNLVIPGTQQLHRLPRDIQVLELTNYPNTASSLARTTYA